MSRRRQLKKQRRRRRDRIERIEELYLRRDDDAFLAAAQAHTEGMDDPSFASMYREVADRALTGALNGGDPARLGELLARIRPAAASLPLAALAEAAAQLSRGRCEAAARLSDLDEAAAPGIDRRLPARLRALAGGDSDPPEAEDSVDRDIAQAAQLFRAVASHAEGGRLPRRLDLENPAARAVWELYRALAAAGARGGRPGAKTLAAIRRVATAVTREVRLDGPGTALLRSASQHVQAIEALRRLGQSLRRRRTGATDEQMLAGLSRVPELAALLREDPPPLARPLHGALEQRWRELLELVEERQGEAGLARLLAARPDLVAADLEVDARPEEVQKWSRVQSLVTAKQHRELAGFLRSQSTAEGSAERRAALWSLELWALREAAEAGESSPSAEVEWHDVLLRLLAMAKSVDASFDADERPQVARFLRTELAELSEDSYLCDHFQHAAEALLRYLRDDALMLAVAFAGAVFSGDERARQRLAKRLAGRGPAPADREALLRLVVRCVSPRPPLRGHRGQTRRDPRASSRDS